LAVGLTWAGSPAEAGKLASAEKVFVIFSFGSAAQDNGWRLADSVQVRLRRHARKHLPEAYVVSWIELENELGEGRDRLAEQLPQALPRIAKKLNLAKSQELFVICGRLSTTSVDAQSRVGFYRLKGDLRKRLWQKDFSGEGERWKPIISGKIVEAVLKSLNVEYTGPGAQTTQPNIVWDKSILKNGNFERGKGIFPADWAKPDGLCSFWVDDPAGGKRMLFDTHVLQKQAWAWWKKLKEGANPRDAPQPIRTNPPHYDAVGGIEGVKLYSDFVPITYYGPYLISAKISGPEGGNAKIFVKGYALLPGVKALEAGKRDSKLERREVWRTYMHCKTGPAAKTYEMDFTLPAELPALVKITKDRKALRVERKVRWLRIMPYAYWPVGKYYFDDLKLRPGKKLEKKPGDNVEGDPDTKHAGNDGHPQK